MFFKIKFLVCKSRLRILIMTYSQLLRHKTKRRVKAKWTRTPDLRKCPQKKGYCFKFVIKSPKKPHSARRKTTRVFLLSIKKHVYCYIPGIGYGLQKYSNVLVRGGRRRDIPGMKYTAIRGKYHFGPPAGRRTARSKYGIKRWV